MICSYFRWYTIERKFQAFIVEIYQVLREIWLFEHEFQDRNFGQLRIFRDMKFV